ncbi:MspA family porin [Nocardia sp. NPDC050630]|uniref:MspA family porin n=1 Tax=Nocardia sp. NPDC050630 TaxID=3364321 RepID=UPI0037957B9F
MPNFLMTFAHAAQLSGDYTLNVEGDGIASGQAVAGFLLGCALNVDNGFTVGIDPNQGLLASISPEFSQSNVAATLPNTAPTPVPTSPPVNSASRSPVTTSPSLVTTSPSAAATSPGPVTTSPSAAATRRSPVTTSASAATTRRSPVTTSASAATTSQIPAPTSQSAAATTSAPSFDVTTPSVEVTTPSVEVTTPSVEPTTPSASVPSASLGPTVGGTLGLAQVLEATLAPGQITTVTTVTTNLDNNTVFPYHFTFNNAALNVGQCASPVSAVPFITATVSTAVETVQTSAYGSQFTF